MTEAQRAEFFAIRRLLDSFINKIADVPAEINRSIVAIRPWKEGKYAISDVRMYEGNPYRCVQAHDSTGNPAWNPSVASLWMQYHGTSPETARPWIAPTGAHDMYKAGEYMLWTDNNIYKCTYDTTYSPAKYGQAWDIVE